MLRKPLFGEAFFCTRMQEMRDLAGNVSKIINKL